MSSFRLRTSFFAPIALCFLLAVGSSVACSSDEPGEEADDIGVNAQQADAGDGDVGPTDAATADADEPDAAVPDAGEPDADEPDADEPDADELDADVPPAEENACGGSAELVLDGESAQPGETCGACDDGTVVCDGVDALRCVATTEPNECGGCEPLHAQQGDTCGHCEDGTYQCDGDGGLECVDATEPNECGGCTELDDNPNDNCTDGGFSGVFGCTGPDDVRCVVAGENACGGSASLDDAPGTSCGTCGGGVVTCDGLNDTECVDADRGINDCGGCAQLPGMVDHLCGGCDGQFVCDGENDLFCEGGTGNACGGCSELEAFPGEPCDETSAYVCDGADSLRCPDEETNACGGFGELEDEPFEPCGPCDVGELVCATPNDVVCVGETETNACGGCSTLVGEPGGECGDNLVWQCDGEDELVCVLDPDADLDGVAIFTPTTRNRYDEGEIEEFEAYAFTVDEWGYVDETFDVYGETWSSNDSSVASVDKIEDGLAEVTAEGAGRTEITVEFQEYSFSVTVTVRYPGPDWELEGAQSKATSNTLTAIWVVDADDAWAVGDGGVTLHYDGDQWESVDNPTGADLRDVWASDSNDVWAVGTGGEILHYDGNDWASLDTPADEDLYGLWGSGPDDIWVVGADVVSLQETGGIFHYDGQNWTAVDNPADHPLLSVWGSGPDDIWAVEGDGGEEVIHFDGQQWEVAAVPEGYDWHDVWGTAADDIWMVADSGTIMHYDGASWSEFGEGDGVPYNATARIWGTSSSDLWVTGFNVSWSDHYDDFYHYDGSDWDYFDGVPVPERLNAVMGAAPDDLWAVGEDGAILHFDGSLWRWNDGLTPLDLEVVWGRAADDVWALGEDAQIFHYDGDQWDIVANPFDDELHGIWASAADDVWVVGGDTGFSGTSIIGHYDGQQWTKVDSPIDDHLIDVWGAGENEIWAVGDDAILFYDGTGWEIEVPSVPGWPRAGWASGSDDVWIAGDIATDDVLQLLHYDATEWHTVDTPVESSGHGSSGPSSPRSNAIWGSGSDDVWAVGGGNDGNVLHFDGNDWSPAGPPTTEWMYGVSGTGPDDVWVVGASAIWRFDGDQWLPVMSPVGFTLNDIWLDPATGKTVAVGRDGTIIYGEE